MWWINCIICILGLSSVVGSLQALKYSGNGETKEHWNNVAATELKRAKQLKPNIAVAKNVILFLGDGMGVSTVTAARILKGQLKGNTGEEEMLSFETWPHVGLSKTYNQDAQTADSAGTATAYLTGVKTNLGILGLDGRSRRRDCSTEQGTKIYSIGHWSKDAGKSVGIVTTTRVTHATPGAMYAHTANRDWENDRDMAGVTGGCRDIASQLIDDNIDINVILGGGRVKFMKNDTEDPEEGWIDEGRLDGRDLIQEWQQQQQKKSRTNKYVWNRTDFEAVDATKTDYLLGLFGSDHMQYETDRAEDKGGEPSLAQMAEKAINILKKNPNGYFLLVEGGRIDHAHHDGKASKALHDTIAFDEAIRTALTLTSETDTLLVTTADHSHTFTIGGYPTRGNPIMGLTDDQSQKGHPKMANDNKPYTTLHYANGPGGYAQVKAVTRPDPSKENTTSKNYMQQSGIPLDMETHAGEDVAIYARGPMSHLFHGLHEQNYIAHVMAYASCVGGYNKASMCARAEVDAISSSAVTLSGWTNMLVLLVCLLSVYFKI